METHLLDSGVLELIVERPPVNSYSIDLLNDIGRTLEGIGDRAEIRAVVLRARGRGFCGGGDLKEVQALPGSEGILGQAAGSLRASLAMIRCAVPVVCAVHAYCVGVGVLLAGSADVLIAARNTRFVLAEVDNGAVAGGVQALRLMPEKRARVAMMTAEPIMGEELHALGTLYAIREDAEEAAAGARLLAVQIAAKNPAAMRRLKQSLNNSSRAHEVEAAYRAELSYTYELNMTGTASEARSAFLAGERKGYVPGSDLG
jgi:enoyl-CoA hydratase